MKISARNQIKGKVSKIVKGSVNCELIIDLGKNKLKSIITKSSVADMGLKVGDKVTAIIKASNVILSKDKLGKISASNVFKTSIKDISKSDVNCEVKLSFKNYSLVSVITSSSAKDLKLKKGDCVYAVVKASSIMVAK